MFIDSRITNPIYDIMVQLLKVVAGQDSISTLGIQITAGVIAAAITGSAVDINSKAACGSTGIDISAAVNVSATDMVLKAYGSPP